MKKLNIYFESIIDLFNEIAKRNVNTTEVLINIIRYKSKLDDNNKKHIAHTESYLIGTLLKDDNEYLKSILDNINNQLKEHKLTNLVSNINKKYKVVLSLHSIFSCCENCKVNLYYLREEIKEIMKEYEELKNTEFFISFIYSKKLNTKINTDTNSSDTTTNTPNNNDPPNSTKSNNNTMKDANNLITKFYGILKQIAIICNANNSFSTDIINSLEFNLTNKLLYQSQSKEIKNNRLFKRFKHVFVHCYASNNNINISYKKLSDIKNETSNDREVRIKNFTQKNNEMHIHTLFHSGFVNEKCLNC